MNYYIGIDLGTSSVKAILSADTGEVIERADYSYETVTDPTGRSEIDPDIWFEGVMHCLRQLTRDIKNIRAIGVTGQMHSLILLDGEGKAVRPVLMWNDLRTKDQVSELRAVAEKNGLSYITETVSTGSPAANLLFVREKEPDVFKRIKKILIGHDYVAYKLTGHAGADYCEASTSSLYDIENRCWAAPILEYIGVDAVVLPELLPSCSRAGILRRELCDELGLVSAPAVTEGTGDNTASMIALAVPCISLGTSGVFIEKKSELRGEKKGKNILLSLKGEAPSVVVQGVVQAVGSTMEWLKGILGADSVKEMLEAIPGKIDGELLFYPHLNGDKTLYHDSTLKGAFFGLSLNTTREDLVAAAVEGICFALRQMVEQVSSGELRRITVTGGLARSSIFMQMLSDVLECRLETAEDNPGAVYGAVILAMNMDGNAPSPKAKIGRLYTADESMSRYYREKYRRYLQIHDKYPR